MVLLKEIVNFLDQKKCENILTIDLKEKTSVAESMVLATCVSGRQVMAVSELLKSSFKELGYYVRIDGKKGSEWIVVEIDSILTHLFKAEIRCLYNLEELWL